MRYLSSSHKQTQQLGFDFGKRLEENSVLCFFGDLGSGKTTFIKGVVAACTDLSPDVVNSPTFVYLNIYEGKRSVYHFDLYRLRDARDFLKMGFDEYLDAGGISCIEWSERIEDILPQDFIKVTIRHVDEGRRWIEIG